MNLGAQLLEPLLVGDAEMLLLVDDEKAEIPELDGLAEQRMGTDDDVDLAFCDFLLHPRQLGRRDQPRGLRDVHGKTAESLREGFGVLAREQRGRHDHRNLLAVHRGHESRAQRDFGLAETHVTANQSIHRSAGAQFAEHVVDGGLLILGLLVGKTCTEFIIEAVPDRQLRRFPQLPLGRDLDQLVGNVADAALHARLARLPGTAAEPVELDVGLFRAVARKQLDVLDR